jgi:molybdopterin synthase sulfur carrier subunit
MRVRFRLFSTMRLAAGAGALDLEAPDGSTLAAALDQLYESHPELRPYRATALVAVGLDYAAPERILAEGDEISIVPPVQGG